MSNFSIVNVSGIDLKTERDAAAILDLDKPGTYLGKTQARLARQVEKLARQSDEADKAAMRFAMMNVREAAKVVRTLMGDDEVESVKSATGGREFLTTKATVDSEKFADKARVTVRRAVLTQYLRTAADFNYLTGVTDEERAKFNTLNVERRKVASLPKKQRAEAMSDILAEFSELRESIINRLAKDGGETDKALQDAGVKPAQVFTPAETPEEVGAEEESVADSQ